MKSFNIVAPLVVLTLLEGFSFFGRTSALSPFLPSLCSDLSLSMTQLSGAYMLANLIAGLLLPFVGKCYDRAGLADFTKAFVKIFAFSFVIIGVSCTLGVDTRSGGKMNEWMTEYSVILLLMPLAFPGSIRAIISTFFENQRHKLLFFATGVTVLWGTVFVYTVAAGLDRFLWWSCAAGYVFLLHFIVLHFIPDRKKRAIFFIALPLFILFRISVFAFVEYSDPMPLLALFIGVLFCMVSKLKPLRRKWRKLQKKLEAYGINFERLILPLLIYWRIKHSGKEFHRHCHQYQHPIPWRNVVYFINVAALFFFFHEYKTASPTAFGCTILFFAFIGIRTAVQAYTLAGRSWLATHFSKRRGFATGCVQLCVTIITASTPVICYQISQHWTCGTFFCMLSVVWFFGLFVCSCLPEKPSPRTECSCKTPTSGAIRQFPDGSRLLLGFMCLTLFFRNAQNSGIAFHLVPMCRDFGVNAKMVSAAFMPISLLAVGMTFLFGHYFKRLGSRMYLGLFLLSDAGMLYAVKHIDTAGMLWLFIACTGLYWGINNIIASMVIPVLFGTNHIGALNGFAFGAVSLGSAVGPFFFSIMKDVTSYKSALTLCIDGVFLLFCLFALLQNRIKSAEAGA